MHVYVYACRAISVSAEISYIYISVIISVRCVYKTLYAGLYEPALYEIGARNRCCFANDTLTSPLCVVHRWVVETSTEIFSMSSSSSAASEFRSADSAWDRELVKVFGAKSAQAMRYVTAGKGMPGSVLRGVYEAREAARIAFVTSN